MTHYTIITHNDALYMMGTECFYRTQLSTIQPLTDAGHTVTIRPFNEDETALFELEQILRPYTEDEYNKRKELTHKIFGNSDIAECTVGNYT